MPSLINRGGATHDLRLISVFFHDYRMSTRAGVLPNTSTHRWISPTEQWCPARLCSCNPSRVRIEVISPLAVRRPFAWPEHSIPFQWRRDQGRCDRERSRGLLGRVHIRVPLSGRSDDQLAEERTASRVTPDC